MMRKIAWILVTVVFLLNLCGYYPLFKLQQRRIHRAVERHLAKMLATEREHIVTIGFKKDQPVKWERPGKEFKHNGTMYDVLKHETRGDSIFYYCFNDREETYLLDLLTKAEKDDLEKSSRPFKNSTQNLLNLFSRTAYTGPPSYNLYCPVAVIQLRHAADNTICRGYESSILQPPEFTA